MRAYFFGLVFLLLPSIAASHALDVVFKHAIARNPFALLSPQHILEPLEAYPLDALHFVGTFRDEKSIWALVSQPGGLLQHVKVGSYLGRHHGKVIFIKETSLILEEPKRRRIVMDIGKA